MRKSLLLILFLIVSFMAYPQTKIVLAAGGSTMTATLIDNDATHSLKSLLEKGDISIRMSDYGGFEKVGALPQSLPTTDTYITTEPGDIMLYQGNNIVIFYGSNSWSYTRLGKIDCATPEGLREFLGTGNITLTISLVPSASAEAIMVEDDPAITIYDLQGRPVTSRPLPSGIYIKGGKKIRIS